MSEPNAPAPPPVPLDLWRALYRAALSFQALAPWEWMNDTHVLGINNEHGVRLLSVLGQMREVYGLAAYRGTSGSYYLLRLLRGDLAPDDPEAHYHMDTVLLDYVPRKDLRPEDLGLLQRVGVAAAASRAKRLPQFYSYKPGYVPWFLDEAEVRSALDNLEKSGLFAQLIRANPTVFDHRGPNEFPFFPDSFTEPLSLDQFVWHIMAPTAPPCDPLVDPEEFDLAALRQRPRRAKTVWEVSAAYTKLAIGEPPRPYWPKMGLAAEAQSGSLLGFHVGTVKDTMAETAARTLVHSIEVHGCRPAAAHVDSFNLGHGLVSLATALSIKLYERRSLPALEAARRSLEAFTQEH